MKNLLNCAPVLALVASGLAGAAPLGMAPPALSPASIAVHSDSMTVAFLMGPEVREPLARKQQQQQQQQQQQKKISGDAVDVYAPPLTGFAV